MNKYIFLFAIIALTLFSCGSKTQKNSTIKIKNQVEAIEKLVLACDNNIQSAIESKRFDYIELTTKETINSCDTILNELKSLEVSPNQNNLKIAAVSYVISLKEIVITEQEYSKLSDSTSLVEANKMDDKLMKASVKAKNEYAKYKNSLDKVEI